ncbi:MAG: hypothetical protein ACRCYY_16795 [Trueperaceae bacterium]
MKLDAYHAILKQVEIALTELGKAEGMFGNVEDMFQQHPFLDRFLKLEERVHILTHENASAIAFELEDVRHQLKRLETMLEFPEFSEAEFERIESELWSLALFKRFTRACLSEKWWRKGKFLNGLKNFRVSSRL